MCAEYNLGDPKSNAASCGQTALISWLLCTRLATPDPAQLRERRNEGAPMAKSHKPKSKHAKPAASDGRPDAATLRIADALERLAPKADAPTDFDAADAFIWAPQGLRLMPVLRVNRVEMMLLKG